MMKMWHFDTVIKGISLWLDASQLTSFWYLVGIVRKLTCDVRCVTLLHGKDVALLQSISSLCAYVPLLLLVIFLMMLAEPCAKRETASSS